MRLLFIFIFVIIVSQESSFSANRWELTDSLKVLVDTTNDGNPIWAKCTTLGLTTLNQKEVFWYGNLETNSPFIMKSKDSGKTFNFIYRDSFPNKIINGKIYFPHRINNFSVPNKKLFIVVGDSGLIIRSTDKGETWLKTNLDLKYNLLLVSFWDELNGLCFGVDINQKGKVFFSSDGGEKWEIFQNVPFYYDLDRQSSMFTFEDGKLLFTDLYLLKNTFYFHFSDDIGINWNSYKGIQKYQNCDFYFKNVNEGYYSGIEDEEVNGKTMQFVYKTENRGVSWTKVLSQSESSNLFKGSISFSDSINGILSGYYTVWRTSDKGFNWYLDTSFSKEQEPIPESSKFPKIDKVVLLNKNCAVGISDYPIPKVLHYTGSDPVSVKENLKADLKLFPNPVTTSFSLSEIPEGAVSFEIINVFGEKVMTVETIHELSLQKIDVSTLSAGVYFIRIGNERPIKFIKL